MKFELKKIVILCSILLVAIVGVFAFPNKVFAATGTVVLNSDKTSVAPGETIVVTAGYSTDITCQGSEMELSFSNDILEVVSVECVEAQEYFGTNPIKVAYEDATGKKAATLLKVTFKVKNSAVSGQRATITVSNGLASSMDANFNTTEVYLPTKSVTVTVASAKSTNAQLGSLSVKEGIVIPAFSADVTSYTVNVANSVTAVTVNAAAADNKAKVTVSGNTNLKVGKNEVKVVVTAEAGNSNTYIITVNRAAAATSSTPTLSKDAQLSALNLGTDFKLNFSPTVYEYGGKVPYDVTSLPVTATARDSKAKVQILVNSKAITDGKAPLIVGDNYVIVKVTASDGKTVRSYNIVVTREKEATSSAPPSSDPVSSQPESSEPSSSSQPASSGTTSSEPGSSEPTTSENTSSQDTVSENISSEDASSDAPSASDGTSSDEPTSGNPFLDWLRQDRSSWAVHTAYIGGMIVCLLGGCMLGYYLRGRKDQ